MKGKKLIFAVILALIVCLVLIPVSAYAEGEGEGSTPGGDPVTTSTGGGEGSGSTTDPAEDVPQPPTAAEEQAIVDANRVEKVADENQLEQAVSNVQNDTIVEVTNDITVSDATPSSGTADPISVTANDEDTVIIIDLGGKVISSETSHPNNTDVFSFKSGKITVRNGTINGNIRVQDKASVYLDQTLVLNGFVLVKGGTDTAPAEPKLNVDCEINNDKNATVMTNGSYTGGKITISENARLTSTSADGSGMYLPGNAKVTVNGGSITGKTGIYMKAGTLVMNGGTVTATGEKKGYTHDGDGYHPTGDAIFIDYIDGYKGIQEVTINNGTIVSENGKTVVAYKDDNTGSTQTEGENLKTTGGIYSDDSALDFVDKNSTVIAKSNGKYAVGDSVLDVVKPGETVEIVNLPDEFNNGTIDLPAGITIVNGTDKAITMNGITLESGESFTVPGAEFTYTEAYSKYYVIDGMNAEWTKGSADGLTFKLNSEDVIKVLIDGVEVEFTVENGEIVISAEVLEALEAGEHEIEFVFADGSCKTEFTVK